MDKREMILQAALKLFTENGIDKTPTAQISKEAGVASGTLFYYFPSKDDLVSSLYLHCKESAAKELKENIEKETSCHNRVKLVYINFINWCMKYPKQYLFFLQFSNSKYISQAAKEEGLRKFESLKDIIMDGIHNEELKEIKIEFLYQQIAGMLEATATYFSNNEEDFKDKEFLEKAFSFFWDSIKR